MVRAKFRVSELTTYSFSKEDKGSQRVVLTPVTGDTPENKTWAKYTPCGKIEMSIDNPAALAQFPIGQEFYVDFTPAAE